jgi:hypothetical protein
MEDIEDGTLDKVEAMEEEQESDDDDDDDEEEEDESDSSDDDEEMEDADSSTAARPPAPASKGDQIVKEALMSQVYPGEIVSNMQKKRADPNHG